MSRYITGHDAEGKAVFLQVRRLVSLSARYLY